MKKNKKKANEGNVVGGPSRKTKEVSRADGRKTEVSHNSAEKVLKSNPTGKSSPNPKAQISIEPHPPVPNKIAVIIFATLMISWMTFLLLVAIWAN